MCGRNEKKKTFAHRNRLSISNPRVFVYVFHIEFKIGVLRITDPSEFFIIN